MFKELPPLNSLLAFEASARLNSFKLAADELHQTPAAIAYQIKKLEESLGLLLFTRHHKGVQLNQTGQTYHSQIQTILKQLASQTQNLKQSQSALNLRILTLHAIAEKWLMPRLNDFRQLHPGVNIEITATDAIEKSQTHDIVIGFSQQQPTHPDMKILMEEEIFPVCSADYFASHQIKLESLANHDLMIDVTWNKDWEYWLQANNLSVTLKPHHSLSFSLYSMVIDAAVKGMGIMMGHMQLISPELENNSLVEVFANSKPVSGYYTLMTNNISTNHPKIELFTNWLYQQAK